MAENILASVKKQIKDQKIKALKSTLKELLEEREKALSVVKGIDEKIIDACSKAGLDEREIREAITAADEADADAEVAEDDRG